MEREDHRRKRFWRNKAFMSIRAAALALMLAASGCGESAQSPEASTGAVVPAQANAVDARTGNVFDPALAKGKLAVVYLDLKSSGQSGDCIVIRSPDGKTMMIDAGIPEVGPQVLQYLQQMEIRSLDIVVNTHPHPDHIGGLASVLRNVNVGKFYMINMPMQSWSAYASAMSAAKAKNIVPEYLEEGASFQLGKDVRIEALSPWKGELPDAMKNSASSGSDAELGDVNNRSLVLLLTYKDTRFLFTADIHLDREVELVDKYGERLRADFMDAPHHGISTSSSQKFLNAVSPKVAVINRNIFDNYAQLLKYMRSGIDTYVTAQVGSIAITSDGKKLAVVTEREKPQASSSQTSQK